MDDLRYLSFRATVKASQKTSVRNRIVFMKISHIIEILHLRYLAYEKYLQRVQERVEHWENTFTTNLNYIRKLDQESRVIIS